MPISISFRTDELNLLQVDQAALIASIPGDGNSVAAQAEVERIFRGNFLELFPLS